MASSSDRQYSREEVEEILRRAAERTEEESGGDGLAHEDLVAAAREAGIDVGAVEHAVGEVATRRIEQQWVETWDARRKRRFGTHFLTYAVVIAGLFLLNLLSAGVWWFLWPAAVWGIFLALHATLSLRAPTPEQVAKVTRRERRRLEADRKRDERRAAREALRQKMLSARAARGGRAPGHREFERAVEAGVAALLEVVAKKVDAATGRDRQPLPDTEFNRYVTSRKDADVARPRPKGAAGSPSQSQSQWSAPLNRPPRVRVEDPGDEDASDLEEDERSRRSRRGRS